MKKIESLTVESSSPLAVFLLNNLLNQVCKIQMHA